ncbi:MAG: hypothetical protein LBM03_01725 [Erysipelotrichaceae bacterium]|jgi:hypothetical protein|nr:hypothetical protein [Erysipelotrichaceae bacterium]
MEKFRRQNYRKSIYHRGEDYETLKENNYERNKKEELPICDRHEDGA